VAGRVTLLIDRIREAKGPFFVARINLRVRFPLGRGEVSDSPELERQILDVCRELGFDATELAGGAAAK
jgi:hypothetical protein